MRCVLRDCAKLNPGLLTALLLTGCATSEPRPAAEPPVMPTGIDVLATAAPDETDVMDLHIIDVGQGAAALLEFSCGAVLVDTGGEQNSNADSNGNLKSSLNKLFARRSDLNRAVALVVLSHPHVDHIRGVSQLRKASSHITLLGVVDNGQVPDSQQNNQRKLQEWAQDNANYLGVINADLPPVGGFTSGPLDPFNCEGVDPTFTALWGSTAEDPDNPLPAEFDNPNNHSVVLRADFGEASFLFLGDLEGASEAAMLTRYSGTSFLDVDVLQASHHGAENGTSEDLLVQTTPEIIFVQSGNPDNRGPMTAFDHGHPRKRTMLRFVDAVDRSRAATVAMVASGQDEEFEEMTIAKAIFGTAWDGNIRIRAKADGTFRVTTDQ